MSDLLTEKDFIRIGYSAGLTGYKGALKVALEPDIEEYFFHHLQFVYFLREGMFVPFFIREKTSQKLTLKFERILGREEALHLTDQPFYARIRDLPQASRELLYHRPGLLELAGYRIYDHTQQLDLGAISHIEEYPGGWMAEIKREGGEVLLIPLAEPLIEGIDEKEQLILMRLPEGITDL